MERPHGQSHEWLEKYRRDLRTRYYIGLGQVGRDSREPDAEYTLRTYV
jgi:hypothetical protein